jgi:serine/threonine protein phosphatase PrpC
VSGANGVTALDGPRSKPLGIRPTFAYATGTRKLEPGDCLFLFTDGITEAMDPAGDWFSEERLEEMLQSLAGEPSTVVGKVIAKFGNSRRPPASRRHRGHGDPAPR